MKQFNYFPCIDTDSRNLSSYSLAASILFEEIFKELVIHKLFLSTTSIIKAENNAYNFHVDDKEYTRCYQSLGELDREVGYLIRSYGKLSGSGHYIADRFLPFSATLNREDKEFRQAIDQENRDLQNIQVFSRSEKNDLLAFYGISCNETIEKAIKFYGRIYSCEEYWITSYVIYNFLSLSVHFEGSNSNTGVSDLIRHFVRRI